MMKTNVGEMRCPSACVGLDILIGKYVVIQKPVMTQVASGVRASGKLCTFKALCSVGVRIGDGLASQKAFRVECGMSNSNSSNDNDLNSSMTSDIGRDHTKDRLHWMPC
jgi:hypothetical protein